MDYRRNQARFILETNASLVTPEGRVNSVLLRDLSGRGAGIILDDYFLEEGQKVTLIINAPFFFSKVIFKEAKVVWCKKIDQSLWQAGLDFGLDNPLDLSYLSD